MSTQPVPTAREAAKCRRAQHTGPAYHAWRDSAMRVLQEARRGLPTVHHTVYASSVGTLVVFVLKMESLEVEAVGLLCTAEDAATRAFGLGRGHERGRLGIDAGAGPATQG